MGSGAWCAYRPLVRDSFTRLQLPVRPMLARSVAGLPDVMGEHTVIEPKADGVRAIALRGARQVVLQSRQLRSLTRFFPEIVAGVLEGVPDGVALDGELVVARGGGLDFGALQQRLHATGGQIARAAADATASLMVFDLLAVGGEDLRGRPYHQRRAQLVELLDGVGAPLVLMPTTQDLAVARAWQHEHTEAGIEGVVIKNGGHAYAPARRSWGKAKTVRTAETIVGGVTGSLRQPQALLLGRRDVDGRLRLVGRTSPLSRAAQQELSGVLVAARHPHPWPATVRSGRFGGSAPRRLDYTRTEPVTVVEVTADACYDGHRFRHLTRFQRVRFDLEPDDVALVSPAPQRR